ncbi:MAG: hypothetical protein QOE31_1734, partial [Solirubrobacteraceae bacterium]|nr:hypothetical protein [Solirubrobacteraceae bacterium]
MGHTGRAAMTAICVLTAMLAAAPSASAVTLDGARSKALQATKAERAHNGIILFGTRAPIRAHAAIRETGRPTAPAGSSRRVMPSVLGAGSEPAYFFYLDRGAHQAARHAGRVVLVGARTGKVLRSRTIAFAPAIDGRLPVFLRSREGYESARYRVAATDYAVAGATARAASPRLGSFGASPRSVASLDAVTASFAAEHSCGVTIGGGSSSVRTLGSPSGTATLPVLRYDPAAGVSLASFVASQAIAARGCRDVLIAISGDGYRSLPTPTVRTRVAPSGKRMREYHVSATMLRSIVAANPSVTFKLMIDAPGSGGFIEALKSQANVLVIATSSTAAQTAFRYLPRKRIGGQLAANPLRMRTDSSFFTTLMFGGAAFAASDAEVAHARAEVAADRAPSFLAWMVARAFALSRPFDFTSDLGATQRLYVNGFTPSAPVSAPVNGAPVATPQSVSTPEDTAKAITLAGSDPDGNPLTFAIAGAPAHGTLSGSAPNLTYTPAADYVGPDSFAFTVSDGSLISAVATVSITVTAADDPPVTTAGGTLAYTENDPPAAIAPALTVADGDSVDLTGATVQITGNLRSGEDLLDLPAQANITSAYAAASGTLTLSGTATVAAYEAALRAVTYQNSSDDPSTSARTVAFKARDAGGFGPASTSTITVAPVNDAPAITTSAGPLSYTEGDPATPIDAGLVLTDPDSQITGATVQITANHADPQDVLALAAPPAGIGAAYDSASGTLTLTGTASVAAYQSALRAVTYRNASPNPSTAQRTVTFLASDASTTSAPATRAIAVGVTDNAPDVDNSPGALAYTENDPATAIDTAITITDPDSANLSGATVQITGNYASSQDVLALPAQPNISASPYDTATGTLTLAGTATIAEYEAALEAVTYRNASDDPSTATRTITFQTRDAGGFGLADTHAVTIAAVDDPPAAVDDSATVGEDSGATAIAVLPNDSDVDVGSKSIGSVTQPANGTVVITGGGSGLTYAPNANYCNTGGGGLPDTFTYTLTPGGSSATVSMTVTCADDAPVAVADSTTVAEDSGAGDVAVLSNDTDLDGGPKTIASASDPANGTVVLTGGSAGAHTGLTYAPDANYCNTPPPTAPDTFTYTLNGGSIATVSVTVTCADDAPVAVGDSATVGEDSGATAIDVLANDTDVDGGPKTIASASDAAHGTVLPTGGSPGAHSGLNYAPDTNYCNSVTGSPDTFTYTLNGGSTATVSVTVTCADDPAVAANDFATVSEDAAATALSVLGNDSDVENDAITIASASDPANGTVVLTGGSPGAHSGLTYQPDANYCNSPAGTDDSFSYTVNGGSTATVFVTVTCSDDPPVAVNDSATVLEDASATAVTVLANDTDVDAGPKTIASAGDPLNGTVVLTGGSPGAHTGLTYQPDPNYCNTPAGLTDSFSYTLNGGSSATVFMTVTCVDDVPTAVDDSATVSEDAGATAVGVLANDFDGDGGAVTIASASDPLNGTVVLTGGAPGAHTGLTYQPDPNYCNTPPPFDTFTYTINGGDSATVSMTVTCVDDPPVAVNDSAIVSEDSGAAAVTVLTNDTDIDGGAKTISSASDPANGTVVLTGGAPGAHTGLTYQPDPNYCNTPPPADTFTYTLNGGSSATVSMTVTCVDDAPVAVNDSATVLEDASATAVAVLTNDTDIDGGPKTISSASDPANGTVVLSGGAPGAHTGLTYQPDPNYCNDPPGTTPDTFTYTLNGGSVATVSMTVTCVNDAPVADDETFNANDSAIGNTTMVSNDPDDAAPSVSEPSTTISGDILAGDTDIDGPGPLTVTPGTFATNDGGSVTIEADGDFVFRPAAATSCTDTSDFFDYTVEDSGSPVMTDTGRVTVAIAGCVWYVSNNFAGAPDNQGTSQAPFNTLAQAETASGANHTVFVFDGDNTATGYDAGGYQMNSGERLIGEHEGLVVDPDGAGPLTADTLRAPNPGAYPTLTANNADVIDLDDNNEIRGFNIDAQGTGGGIFGGSGDVGGTLDDINVVEGVGTAGQGPGLELNTATGTFTITNLAINNSASGILLNGAGLTTDFGSTTVTTTGPALSATSTNMSTSTFDALTSTASNNGGVSMTNTTGTTTFGDSSGTDLSLTTTSGAAPAFLLSNAGTVSVPAGGTANAAATGGPAIDVSGTTITSLTFDTITSSNSASDGVNIQGLGSATFTANASSAITNATGIDFDLDGGSGAVTYDGAITDNTGQLVRVQNTTGGVKDFNGAIGGAAGAAGGNVGLSSNSGATIRFDGGVKLSSSGATPALGATGGGTLAVTDPAASNNTLGTTTSTGQALNVVNTTIHDDDLTFESVR